MVFGRVVDFAVGFDCANFAVVMAAFFVVVSATLILLRSRLR